MEIFFPRIPIETSILVGKQIHKKLYYSSGIISLILLPLAFCFFAKRTIQRSTLGEMNLIWMDTIQLKKMDNLSPNPIRHYPPIRNYTDIVFTGNQREDLIKLEFAGIRIREILKANDTINGLHFLFLEKSKYGTFVETLDKLQSEGAKYYSCTGNNLWFLQYPSDTTKYLEDNCLLCDDLVYSEPKISWWEKLRSDVVHIWLTSWQIIVLYCCFAIAVLIKIKRNKGHY